MAIDRAPYDLDLIEGMTCKKCGEKSVPIVRYASPVSVPYYGVVRECLRLRCGVCGYETAMECCDAH